MPRDWRGPAVTAGCHQHWHDTARAPPGVPFPDISGRYDAELVTAAQESGPSVSFAQHRFAPPPGATELMLVRHGQSEAYVPGRLFPLVGGHGDPPLSAEGAEQGIKVADRLSKEPIAAIYVTTLQRTVQTAAPLAERLGLEPEIEADMFADELSDEALDRQGDRFGSCSQLNCQNCRAGN